MTIEHVHNWRPSPDQWGAYYCASGNCPDGMPEIDATEVSRRLNATDKLSALDAIAIAALLESDGTHLRDILAKKQRAYAGILEEMR